MVTRRDVRVEIQIPGGTQVYAVTAEEEQEIASIDEWNNVFMSSCLRAFEIKPVPVMRVVPELDSVDRLKEFLDIASQIF